jgi:hypothetical protein
MITAALSSLVTLIFHENKKKKLEELSEGREISKYMVQGCVTLIFIALTVVIQNKRYLPDGVQNKRYLPDGVGVTF